eukprot:836095-Pyramimonas_sp.AAC.1
MAGSPADSEAIIPATEEEIQLILYPRVLGNPTNTELSDDDPLRGNPRDVSDLSERIQCVVVIVFFSSSLTARLSSESTVASVVSCRCVHRLIKDCVVVG